MERTLINHPRLTVREVTGSEGPRHDPYGYSEWRAKTPDIDVIVHMGLGVFAVIGTQRINATGKDYDDAASWVNRIMQEYVGYTIHQLDRIQRKMKNRCKAGGRHKTIDMIGYPGDHLEFCTKCHRVVDSFFCEEEVR